MNKKNNILLVEPDFPYPTKSKNRATAIHKNFVPIGLLKLGTYYKSKKCKVRLVRGNKSRKDLNYYKPDKILITSLFTYWSKYVWDSVAHYRDLFPHSEITVGGIYVTLLHDSPEFRKLASKYRVKHCVGLHNKAENFLPDYSLLQSDVDYHVVHAMRGCIRRCKFCGVWRIEPRMICKKPQEVMDEILAVGKNKVIFYDNNLLANPYIGDILKRLAGLEVNGKPVAFESQSGLDGRLLEKSPKLARLIKQARFRNVRIAWDHGLDDARSIKNQLSHLIDVGYPTKDLSVFILYNFDLPYEDILEKIRYCKKWGVQITDCRYRPLDSTSDDYDPRAWRNGQTVDEYYIHQKGGWTDAQIRSVRKRVREHNIEIRYSCRYDKKMEKWSEIHNTFKFFNLGRPPKMEKIEGNKLLQKRVLLLGKIKNACKRADLAPPDLRDLSVKDIDKKISDFIRERGIR